MTRIHEAVEEEAKSGSELLVYSGSTPFLLQTTKVFKLSSIVPGNGRRESVKPQLTLTSIYGNDRTSVCRLTRADFSLLFTIRPNSRSFYYYGNSRESFINYKSYPRAVERDSPSRAFDQRLPSMTERDRISGVSFLPIETTRHRSRRNRFRGNVATAKAAVERDAQLAVMPVCAGHRNAGHTAANNAEANNLRHAALNGRPGLRFRD